MAAVESRLQIRRGQRQAFLRAVRLPRRARAGQRVRATLVLRLVRGGVQRRRVRLRLPERPVARPPARSRSPAATSTAGPRTTSSPTLLEILLDGGARAATPGRGSLRELRAAVEGNRPLRRA